ncbi:MAG: hypothetical protein PHX78_00960 [bacterium]|nr:hypothetical protein [bacterium]
MRPISYRKYQSSLNSFIILFILLLPSIAFSNAQAPDIILYEDKVYELFCNPLEFLYAKEGGRPYFREKPYNYLSSGNWRGYVAFWEAKEDTLYLIGIEAWTADSKFVKTTECRKVDLKELFGEKCVDGKVKAIWFTGELRIPDGKMIKDVNSGYNSIYEKDIILTVETGKVINKKIIDNTQKETPSKSEPEK